MREAFVTAEMIPNPDNILLIRNSWTILLLFVDVKGKRREVLIDGRAAASSRKTGGWLNLNLLRRN